MKKKIGEIEFTIKSSGDKRTVSIWGILFKGDRGDMIGGVYYCIKPEEYDSLKPFIDETLKLKRFEAKYLKRFWGSYIRVGRYGLVNNTNFDEMIKNLGDISISSFNGIDVTINIKNDFQYVVDANMVDKI